MPPRILLPLIRLRRIPPTPRPARTDTPSRPSSGWATSADAWPQIGRAIAPQQKHSAQVPDPASLIEEEQAHEQVGNLAEPATAAQDVPQLPYSHLNPAPDDFRAPIFQDKAILVVHGGQGGSGCVSFFRDAFVPAGPANGGDGGAGGNVYVQAVAAETSLHKLARRRTITASAGENGRGGNRPGARGDDVIITVPVGTVITELDRLDPISDQAEEGRRGSHFRQAMAEFHKTSSVRKRRPRRRILKPVKEGLEDEEEAEVEEEEKEAREDKEEENEAEESLEEEMDQDEVPDSRVDPSSSSSAPETHRDIASDEADSMLSRDHHPDWVLYPGLTRSQARSTLLPRLPPAALRPAYQPAFPIQLDLSQPSPKPILLAVGAGGGLGNPHFASRDAPRPMMATRGAAGVAVQLQLELKILADVGLVGLPNAGKSTVLRALSNARARVGHWAFTTLRPNIGTVVLDRYRGRSSSSSSSDTLATRLRGRRRRARFTVADIPGLIEDAHLNRGLGMEFLRHVERASVLAFVLDLSRDPPDAVRVLWRELGQYARHRAADMCAARAAARVDWGWSLSSPSAAHDQEPDHEYDQDDDPLAITGKPWFVIANKGDLPAAQRNFAALQTYLAAIAAGTEPHPSGLRPRWPPCGSVGPVVIPISAIHGHGMDRVIDWMVHLLDEVMLPDTGKGSEGAG